MLCQTKDFVKKFILSVEFPNKSEVAFIMANEEYYLRRSRQSKKRKNKRNFWFLIFLAFIFVVLLLVMVNYGGKDSSSSETSNTENTEENANDENTSSNNESNSNQPEGSDDADTDSENNANEDEDEDEDKDENDAEDEDDNDSNKDVSTEEVESDDENVTKAYKGDWEPAGTEQSGEHTTDYDDGSQDRNEIKQAVSEVTGVSEDEMIEHWVGNEGEQKVTATIQDESDDQFYKVSLDWVDDKGWKPTKVEELESFQK